MTVVSSREFAINQEKYFDMNTYHDASVYEEVLEPDEDFYSALSADEFKERAVLQSIFIQRRWRFHLSQKFGIKTPRELKEGVIEK